MAEFEHATPEGFWLFQSLVESAKLNTMSINEEAAHRNKPNCRVQTEYNRIGGIGVEYARFDEPHVTIIQGVRSVYDEFLGGVSKAHVAIRLPTGPGLAPFLHRPIPIVRMLAGARGLDFGEDPLAASDYQTVDFFGDQFFDAPSFAAGFGSLALPEANVGFTGLDAGTDFRTSLVATVKWTNNDGPAAHNSFPICFIFWKVVGHVAAI